MKTTIFIDNEGNFSGLSDDLFDKMQDLGTKLVERVSNIEYDHAHKCWVATDMDGCVISTNPVRSVVLDDERKYLNEKIRKSLATKTRE
jgi:hypothetical protein